MTRTALSDSTGLTAAEVQASQDAARAVVGGRLTLSDLVQRVRSEALEQVGGGGPVDLEANAVLVAYVDEYVGGYGVDSESTFRRQALAEVAAYADHGGLEAAVRQMER